MGSSLETLRTVTTGTICTMLLKKGIRRSWMAGPMPLGFSGKRVVGPAFTLRFVPVREDLATPASWSNPISTRAAIEEMPEGCIAVADAMGVTESRHFRRHPLHAHGQARHRRARHRRRDARQARRAGDGHAGLVRRHLGAGVGPSIDLRRLERADRLRRLRDFPRRHHRRRRRRRRGDPKGSWSITSPAKAPSTSFWKAGWCRRWRRAPSSPASIRPMKRTRSAMRSGRRSADVLRPV